MNSGQKRERIFCLHHAKHHWNLASLDKPVLDQRPTSKVSNSSCVHQPCLGLDSPVSPLLAPQSIGRACLSFSAEEKSSSTFIDMADSLKPASIPIDEAGTGVVDKASSVVMSETQFHALAHSLDRSHQSYPLSVDGGAAGPIQIALCPSFVGEGARVDERDLDNSLSVTTSTSSSCSDGSDVDSESLTSSKLANSEGSHQFLPEILATEMHKQVHNGESSQKHHASGDSMYRGESLGLRCNRGLQSSNCLTGPPRVGCGSQHAGSVDVMETSGITVQLKGFHDDEGWSKSEAGNGATGPSGGLDVSIANVLGAFAETLKTIGSEPAPPKPLHLLSRGVTGVSHNSMGSLNVNHQVSSFNSGVQTVTSGGVHTLPTTACTPPDDRNYKQRFSRKLCPCFRLFS